MKSNMRLVGIVPITSRNKSDVDILKNCGDTDADSQAISKLRNGSAKHLTEGVTLMPYNDGLGLSLWSPIGDDDPHKIIGIYNELSLKGDTLVKVPQKLLIGRDAKFVVIIESDCTCCAEKHVLIVEADGEKPVTHKKYSPLENPDVGHDFNIAFPGSSFDITGEEIAHALSELKKTPQSPIQTPRSRKNWFSLGRK